MPTSVTSARIASSGTPIAIATPHPIVAPSRSRTARSAAYSAAGASQTSSAPTISVDTDTASHHANAAHPAPPVRCVGPVLIADLAAHARAAREHGGLVAVAQVAADARRRTEERSVRHGDQIAIDTTGDPHRPAHRYDVARGMSGDPHGPVEHDDVAGSLARRNDGATRDHHMIGRGGRATGSEQDGQDRDDRGADSHGRGHLNAPRGGGRFQSPIRVPPAARQRSPLATAKQNPLGQTARTPLIDPPEPAIRDLGNAAGHDVAVRPAERRRLSQAPHAPAPGAHPSWRSRL